MHVLCPAFAGRGCGACPTDLCLERPAQPLPHPCPDPGHHGAAPRAGSAARPHLVPLERGGELPRAASLAPRGGDGDEIRAALLGDAELSAALCGAAWL